jgi:hypothetical protein
VARVVVVVVMVARLKADEERAVSNLESTPK